jgi:hypothetical protein
MMEFKISNYGCSFAKLLTIKDSEGTTLFQGVLEDPDFKCLMRTIQSHYPMEVCESSDIKFLNGRLRKAEEKITSLEIGLDGLESDHAILVDRINKVLR